jgi:hypothetical protein
VYVQHCYEGDIAEGFQCCDGGEGRTTGKIPVGTSVERNGFLFSRCLTGRPNGGAALTGAKKELTSRVRSVNQSIPALQLFMSFGFLNYFFPLLPLLRPLFPVLYSYLPQVIPHVVFPS